MLARGYQSTLAASIGGRLGRARCVKMTCPIEARLNGAMANRFVGRRRGHAAEDERTDHWIHTR